METFYLGTHQPHWLATADVPLFVSHRRLAGRKTLPRAIEHWALDSGGFSELSLYDEWRTTPGEYVAAVRRYDEEIGELGWAAPQDWMCEPFMTAKTGLSVLDHQRRTVENFLELQELWGDDATSPFMPVLQGWERDDYLRCHDLYGEAGVDLTAFPVVGLGSVCRRQATGAIGAVVAALRQRDPDLPLHGFGVKLGGLRTYGHLLISADSMAWSFEARRHDPLPGCTGHKNCANCLAYALTWRERVVSIPEPPQLDLFGGVA
ncbi:MAG TPA: hypothetical protein VJT49_01770 [Amycolatopsis sp.]|uniref:deazapurine DNA modification protein DpdA family protein n=1 Tax=Amycolatopsis sp. TaxID=37632 RepID=UPI002B4A4C3E|nr:hypothetical protein [Amycolatopsis sp.]HKS43841.1 hypothetical protein [Amycolatopsis sp.]